jgi:hypothetical protein
MAGLRIRHRAALLLAGAVILAPTGFPVSPALGAGVKQFEAPEGPLILTRELRRAIAPGKDIVSRRSYAIRFVRQGTGWRVEGTLAKTEVEAPEELAMFAELEKARKDDGLFPLSLDANGMIVSQQGASDTDAAQNARSAATTSVEKIEMSSSDKVVARHMVQRIVTQGTALGGNWPVDLFRPTASPREQVRDVPLPDGRKGRVTVTMQASPDPRGVMEQFERRVMTELDGTTRLSQETWKLSGGR